jgi:hypothetical protein
MDKLSESSHIFQSRVFRGRYYRGFLEVTNRMNVDRRAVRQACRWHDGQKQSRISLWGLSTARLGQLDLRLGRRTLSTHAATSGDLIVHISSPTAHRFLTKVPLWLPMDRTRNAQRGVDVRLHQTTCRPVLKCTALVRCTRP